MARTGLLDLNRDCLLLILSKLQDDSTYVVDLLRNGRGRPKRRRVRDSESCNMIHLDMLAVAGTCRFLRETCHRAYFDRMCFTLRWISGNIHPLDLPSDWEFTIVPLVQTRWSVVPVVRNPLANYHNFRRVKHLCVEPAMFSDMAIAATYNPFHKLDRKHKLVKSHFREKIEDLTYKYADLTGVETIHLVLKGVTLIDIDGFAKSTTVAELIANHGSLHQLSARNESVKFIVKVLAKAVFPRLKQITAIRLRNNRFDTRNVRLAIGDRDQTFLQSSTPRRWPMRFVFRERTAPVFATCMLGEVNMVLEMHDRMMLRIIRRVLKIKEKKRCAELTGTQSTEVSHLTIF